ncbi:MAG: IPT/TIG domain-containing protein [bacterium]
MKRTPPVPARPWLAVLVLASLAPGCEDPLVEGRAPLIEDVRPAAAPPEVAVTLVGRRFGLRGDRDRVWLGGVELAVESWTDTAVLVRVPARPPGLADLVVRSGPWVSAPYPFEVLAPMAPDDVGDIIP